MADSDSVRGCNRMGTSLRFNADIYPAGRTEIRSRVRVAKDLDRPEVRGQWPPVAMAFGPVREAILLGEIGWRALRRRKPWQTPEHRVANTCARSSGSTIPTIPA